MTAIDYTRLNRIYELVDEMFFDQFFNSPMKHLIGKVEHFEKFDFETLQSDHDLALDIAPFVIRHGAYKEVMTWEPKNSGVRNHLEPIAEVITEKFFTLASIFESGFKLKIRIDQSRGKTKGSIPQYTITATFKIEPDYQLKNN